MSRAYLLLSLLVSGLWGQTQSNPFDKPPVGVDEALRDRVAKFYQAHIDKKFRAAEALVAEETRDYFYEAPKPTFLSFRVDKITYSENFTRAKVELNCKRRIDAPVPGMPVGTDVDLPVKDTWKLENGAWVWYVDRSVVETPFGTRKTEPASSTGPAPALPKTLPTAEEFLNGVKADKQEVQLTAKKPSSDEVRILNNAPGVVKLMMYMVAVPPGFKVALDRNQLKTGEQAKMTFTYTPKADSGPLKTEVWLNVEPMNQKIPIAVTVE
jgi:hypothetical protein